MAKELSHIGIIPDGNRRWAEKKGLSRLKGHVKAVEKNRLNDFCKIVKENKVSFLTLWGFSTENWKRSEKEKKHLFNLFEKVIDDLEDFVHKERVRFRHLGRRDRLPKSLLEKIKKLEKETKNYKEVNLSIALDYGGRDEIIRAVNKALKSGKKEINENEFSGFLDTKELPDFDIIIRTSNEKRLSGFFPFQGVYSELFFVKKDFPDFNPKDLQKIIDSFKNRERRFGGK